MYHVECQTDDRERETERQRIRDGADGERKSGREGANIIKVVGKRGKGIGE